MCIFNYSVSIWERIKNCILTVDNSCCFNTYFEIPLNCLIGYIILPTYFILPIVFYDLLIYEFYYRNPNSFGFLFSKLAYKDKESFVLSISFHTFIEGKLVLNLSSALNGFCFSLFVSNWLGMWMIYWPCIEDDFFKVWKWVHILFILDNWLNFYMKTHNQFFVAFGFHYLIYEDRVLIFLSFSISNLQEISDVFRKYKKWIS